ncbi:serpentine type 7TM GPCR receptor class ab chemoreceptor domain-containing protein [Ditylenchus destructor]|uniref:Serpentine type 7TM GPCR receptor class ab chemoreceptor domain-containing protein n=1 Tax=Ditylenchus destructor TaxID=166010 RepID=A0AAD4R066_9BILA|nr:serpentine type 7TM GPCR receptor class ab chemoreceptor domain-containing protein [Ditylenchus destructor]
MANASENPCITAKSINKDAYVVFSQIGQLILAIISLILLGAAILGYKKQKVALHRNLMLLFGNIILLYAYHNIFIVIMQCRNQVLLYFSSDPCDFLTPVWLNIVLRMPTYIYVPAFTFSHLALTTERARATILARRYEKEGICYPVLCLVLIWALTFLINASIIVLALQDPTFSRPLVHITLTTETNSTMQIYLNLVGFALVIVTAIMDYLLLVVNHKNRSMNDSYSLSRIYQVKENIIVMNLIWPLDVWYAIALSIYYAGSSYIRLIRDKLTSAHFVAYYDILYMGTLLEMPKYGRSTTMDQMTRAPGMWEVDHLKRFFELINLGRWSCFVGGA